MLYTAILKRNIREATLMYPKAVLTQVTDSQGNLYRDGHCHVLLDQVAHIRPREGSYAIITFEAEEYEYLKRASLHGKALKITNILNVVYKYEKPKKVVANPKKLAINNVLQLFKELNL